MEHSSILTFVLLGLGLAGLVWFLATGRDEALRASRETNRALLAAQEALRESEARLQRAVRAGRVGLWDLDVPTVTFTHGDSWEAMLGRPEEGAGASPTAWERQVHPDDVAAVRERLDPLLCGESDTFEAEYRLRRSDGDWLWVLARGGVVARAPNGSPLRASGTHTDITERKLAEEALRDGEHFLRTVLDTSLEGFWITDPSGRLIDVNPAYCRISGRSREELLGMRAADLEAPWSAVDHARRLDEIRSSGGGRFEATHRRRDGALLEMDVSATLVGGSNGAMVCFFRDVTDRKEALARLREREEDYRDLVDNLNAGVLVHAADSSVALCNARASFLLGLRPEQIRGRIASDPSWAFTREDGSPLPVDEYPAVRAAATGVAVENVVVGVHRGGSGEQVWLLLNAHPVRRGGDRRNQVVVSFVDISRRKEAEAELQRMSRLVEQLAAQRRGG